MSVMVFFHGCKSETTGKDVFEETAFETVFDVPSYLRLSMNNRSIFEIRWNNSSQ